MNSTWVTSLPFICKHLASVILFYFQSEPVGNLLAFLASGLPAASGSFLNYTRLSWEPCKKLGWGSVLSTADAHTSDSAPGGGVVVSDECRCPNVLLSVIYHGKTSLQRWANNVGPALKRRLSSPQGRCGWQKSSTVRQMGSWPFRW